VASGFSLEVIVLLLVLPDVKAPIFCNMGNDVGSLTKGMIMACA